MIENEVNNNKKNKIIIISVISIILLAIIIIFLLKFINKNKNDETNELIKKYDENSLIVVKKDNLYGYIDKNGKVMIEPQFLYAEKFKDGYAIVKKSIDNKVVYAIIDKDGNIKKTASAYDKIKRNDISGYWLIEDKLYDTNFNMALDENISDANNGYYSYNNSETKQGGIINPYGKKTYTYTRNKGEYSIIVRTSSIDKYQKNRYCVFIVSAEKYEIVNCDTGKVIYDFVENTIVSNGYNIFMIGNNPISYIYIHDDEIIYTTNDKQSYIKHQDDKDYGYIKIIEGNKYKYFLYDSKKIVDKLPDKDSNISLSDAWEKYSKLSKYSCDTGYGLMKDNKVIVPCEWESITYLNLDNYIYLLSQNKNYILVKKDQKISIYDINKNKIVKDFNAYYVSQSVNSVLLEYKDYNTDARYIYNPLTSKEMKVENKNASITYYTNYFTIYENSTRNYYNMEFKLIYTEK